MVAGRRKATIRGMVYTLVLATIFTSFQFFEYKYAQFHINDSAYGSVFYLLTGFHGFHVIVGSIFIFVCLLRMLNPENVSFTKQHHFGFIAALWYWHFVDIVWIFVYFIIYN